MGICCALHRKRPRQRPAHPALGRILSEQDIKTARIAEAFDRLNISTDEEFRALRDDLRWIHDWRKTLVGLRQKLFWLVLSTIAPALLGFCAQSTLDGIKKGLSYEAREYPAR